LAITLAVAACFRPDGAFHCLDDTQCGAGGRCDAPTGFCSFLDSSCDSGRRYGEFAGGLANLCVAPAAEPPDAGPPDAGPDAGPPAPPSFVLEAHAHAGGVSFLQYTLEAATVDKPFLLVTVQIASNCEMPSASGAISSGPTTSVLYGGVRLAMVASIV